MAVNPTLDKEQVAFLLEHHEVIDALFDLAGSDAFRARFGDLSIDEVLKRYLATIGDDNDAWEHDIGKRYRAVKERETKTGVEVEWDNDLDALERKYRK